MNTSEPRIIVLKLDHRPERDKRITTHMALTARAFGASELWTSGLKDPRISETIQQVNAQWGNQQFQVITGVKWRQRISNWKREGGEVIHLTMYGVHIDDIITQIGNSPKNKLIVVGGPKVPSELFRLADFNVAIGHQPHSEVTALSIFLDRFFNGKTLHTRFSDAKLEILPTPHGKRVKNIE